MILPFRSHVRIRICSTISTNIRIRGSVRIRIRMSGDRGDRRVYSLIRCNERST